MHPSIVPPPDYPHSFTYFYLWRDLRTACMWIAGSALLANFMPNDKLFEAYPHVRRAYRFLIDVVAFVALNFRVCLPSLQAEFMGFRESRRQRAIDRTQEHSHGS